MAVGCFFAAIGMLFANLGNDVKSGWYYIR